jgi:hypothetical protein
MGGLKKIPVWDVFEKAFWLGGPKQEKSKRHSLSG